MTTKEARYIETVGRRKTASARARITPGKQDRMTVNDKTTLEYFGTLSLEKTARESLELAGEKFIVTIRVQGGGMKAQAEAVRHAIARGIIEHNPEMRKDLKRRGYLTRDPRMVERKKFGSRKARRPQQWRKKPKTSTTCQNTLLSRVFRYARSRKLLAVPLASVEVVQRERGRPVGETFDEIQPALADDRAHERRPESPERRPQEHRLHGLYQHDKRACDIGEADQKQQCRGGGSGCSRQLAYPLDPIGFPADCQEPVAQKLARDPDAQYPFDLF